MLDPFRGEPLGGAESSLSSKDEDPSGDPSNLIRLIPAKGRKPCLSPSPRDPGSNPRPEEARQRRLERRGLMLRDAVARPFPA